MFGLEFLAMVASFLLAVDACWARRQGTVVAMKPKQVKMAGPCPRVKDLAWAMIVGGSVTLRLACSVQLSDFQATVHGSTLAASCWVSACSSLLSFLCLYPFLPRSLHWENAELAELATISGTLSLPAFLAVAAMDFCGVGFAQLVLMLVGVVTAALLADSVHVRVQSLKLLMLALGIALLTIAAGGPSMRDDLPKYSGPMAALLVAGVSAILQAKFLVGVVPVETERSYELMCHFVSAVAHIPLVLMFLISGDSLKMPRLADAHLWAFVAMQGVFYIRSLRPLTMILGNVQPSV